MKSLAESVGLRLESVVYDSTEYQFWASELFVLGIPLASTEFPFPMGRFSRREMASFHQRASALNRRAMGDQAAFVLSRT